MKKLAACVFLWCAFALSAAAQTTVFNGISTLSINSNQSLQNNRVIIPPGDLTAGTGSQIRVSFIFCGASSPSCATTGGTGGYAIGSVYIGQANATQPNFNGDQVQVKFGGNGTFSSPANGATVVSDFVTLAQPWDPTKSYMISYFVPLVGGNLNMALGFCCGTNTDYWSEATSGTDGSASTTPGTTMTDSAGFLVGVGQLEVQAGGGAVTVYRTLMGVGK